MTVTIGVPAADPVTATTVEAGVRRLLDDLGRDELGRDELGLGATVTVEALPADPSTAAVIAGTPLATDASLAELLPRPGEAAVALLVARRDLLLAELPAPDTTSDAALLAAMASTLLATLGVSARRLPPLLAGTSAQDAVAVAMAPTDGRPLRIRVAPPDAEAALPDVAGFDLALRSWLFDRFAVPLPPCIEIDAAVAPGAACVQVRDLQYPALPLTGSDDDRGRLATYVAALLTPASVLTPAAADAVLVIAAQALPHSARLARARWTPTELVNLLQVGLDNVRPAPRDLPAVVEAIATAARPDPGTPAEREFPGVMAGLAAFG